MRRLAVIVGWMLLAAGPPLKVFGLVEAIEAISGPSKTALQWPAWLTEISNAAVSVVFTMVGGITVLLLAKIERRLNADKK
ncbi:MAG TPA: hypothetical protein VF459_09355 [Caulobacteraceae bacterium]